MIKNKREFITKLIIILKPVMLLILAGFVYLFVFQTYSVGIPCFFYKFTGRLCPGCGMTRALSAIWNLNFKIAWEYNALSLTVLPIVCIYLLFRWVRFNLKNIDSFSIWEYILLIALMTVTLAYGYIRNI